MPVEAAVPFDSPLMQAWEAHKRTDEYANSLKWALLNEDAEHVKGSLWACFVAGYNAYALTATSLVGSLRGAEPSQSAIGAPPSSIGEPAGGTPRTDALAKELLGNSIGYGRLWDHTRQLERELAVVKSAPTTSEADDLDAFMCWEGLPESFCLDQIFASTEGVPANPFERDDTRLAFDIWKAARASMRAAPPSATRHSREEAYRRAFVLLLAEVLASGWFHADPQMKTRVIAYLHTCKLGEEHFTAEKVLHDAMGIPTNAERAFVAPTDGGGA